MSNKLALFDPFRDMCEIDDAKAEEKYRDGVLELTLPKKAGNGSRKLTVS